MFAPLFRELLKIIYGRDDINSKVKVSEANVKMVFLSNNPCDQNSHFMK